MWDGSNYAAINPLGMFIGAIIMFFVLGMIPGYIIAKVLNGMGKLRIPREVELANSTSLGILSLPIPFNTLAMI